MSTHESGGTGTKVHKELAQRYAYKELVCTSCDCNMRIESIVDKDGQELLNRCVPFEVNIGGRSIEIQPISLMFCVWCGSQTLRLRNDLDVPPSCPKPFEHGQMTYVWPAEKAEGTK